MRLSGDRHRRQSQGGEPQPDHARQAHMPLCPLPVTAVSSAFTPASAVLHSTP